MDSNKSHLIHITSKYFIDTHFAPSFHTNKYKIKLWNIIVSNDTYILPGEFESQNIGFAAMYHRDKHIILPTNALLSVFQSIAVVENSKNPLDTYLTINQQEKHNFII